MVDKVGTMMQVPFSPLRNSSIGFIDDYESGMEASASSMAEEDEDVTEKEEELYTSSKIQSQKHIMTASKKRTILDHKSRNNHHRRMSSGNSSTDSNATHTSLSATQKQRSFVPLALQNSTTSKLSRKEDVPTPSSGYDGDTEGPLGEDPV